MNILDCLGSAAYFVAFAGPHLPQSDCQLLQCFGLCYDRFFRQFSPKRQEWGMCLFSLPGIDGFQYKYNFW